MMSFIVKVSTMWRPRKIRIFRGFQIFGGLRFPHFSAGHIA